MLLYQLLRPLAYISIRDVSKWKIDILLPLIFSASCTTAFFALPERPTIFGSAGFVALLIGLFQILPGFYLTALAAVATFNRPDMDFLMPQPIPTVSISISGKSEEIKLTRRRMLSMLFGYLAFLALLLYFVSIGAQVIAPSAKAIVAVWLHGSIVASFLGIFFFLVGQLIFITMFGLYQLSDRMHQPD